MFDAIIRKTYGYHKKEDVIPLSQIAELTGLDNRDVCRGLSRLKLMNMISRGPNGMTSVVKDYDLWNLSTVNQPVAKMPVAKMRNASGKNATLKRYLSKDNKYTGDKKNKKPYIEGDPAFFDSRRETWRVKTYTGEWMDYAGDVKKNLIYR